MGNIKNIIKKILKESYEDYVLYDIMNRDYDDPEKIKYQKIINQIEKLESDEGENWSEKERNFLRKSLSKVNVPGYKEPSSETRRGNELKTTISGAETTLKTVNSILSDTKFQSRNTECIDKLKELSEELENVISNPNDKLLKGKSLEIISMIQKEIDQTINKCSFKYK